MYNAKSASRAEPPAPPAVNQQVQKRVARTHSIDIRTDGDNLAKRHDEDEKKCEALGCDLLQSSISENYANLNARIAPEKLNEFLKYIGRGGGKIFSHSVSADDKTLEYVDTDARLKNMEALRDKLTKLLETTKETDLKALLEIQKQLSDTQAQIDSAKSTLKYLSSITDMVTLQINYSVEFEDGVIDYSVIKNSFRHAWQGFIANVANAIEFVGSSIPWIPVVVFFLWIIKKVWRRRKRNEE